MKKLLFLFVLFFILSGCAKEGASVTIKTQNEEKVVYVEVADDRLEWDQGLRNRTELDENSGMFFVFTDSTPRVFTMQDVLIPLDMIFIDEHFVISEIHSREPVTVYDGRELVNTKAKAQYVLEVNGGYVQEHNIKVGDIVLAPFYY